jgi:hypothetical protein
MKKVLVLTATGHALGGEGFRDTGNGTMNEHGVIFMYDDQVRHIANETNVLLIHPKPEPKKDESPTVDRIEPKKTNKK